MFAESKGKVPREQLRPFKFDPTDLGSIREVATKIGECDRLDILVNVSDLQAVAADLDTKIAGIAKMMLVNHLAPMLFTLTLLPLLTKTAQSSGPNDVRIVNVNSTAHLDAPASCRFSTLADFNQIFPHDVNGEGYARYAHSKLANAIFSAELQRQLTAQQVPVIVMFPHPGAVATVNPARFHWVDPDETIFLDRTLPPSQGALTPLYCAAHPRVRERAFLFKGKFVMPWGKVREANERLKDAKFVAECWNGSIAVFEGVLKHGLTDER